MPCTPFTLPNGARVQSDEVTYDLERTVVGSVVAGVTADRCGQCGACDRSVVPVAVDDREAGDMAITEAAYAEAQMEIERLRTALENLRRELDRAWREVDAMASERTQHARWRQDLADDLGEAEKMRDALGSTLNKRENDLMMLRNAVDAMMAPLGYHGTISARDDRVQAVMDALAHVDTAPARQTSA